jgi:hypothetical protein
LHFGIAAAGAVGAVGAAGAAGVAGAAGAAGGLAADGFAAGACASTAVLLVSNAKLTMLIKIFFMGGYLSVG